jgi:hypothetical protein
VPQSPELRVSDADRERAAAEIREHFAQGRLDSDELSDRLGRAYGARTAGELDSLRADLPEVPPSATSRRAELVVRRRELSRELLQHTIGGLVPFFVCVAIWVGSGANGGFWPAWVAVFALIPLLRNAWRLYGPAPELERVEDELRRARGQARRRRDPARRSSGRHGR